MSQASLLDTEGVRILSDSNTVYKYAKGKILRRGHDGEYRLVRNPRETLDYETIRAFREVGVLL